MRWAMRRMRRRWIFPRRRGTTNGLSSSTRILPWRMRGWEWCMSNSGQVAKAKPYYSKAYELSAHVSESERLYISSHYDMTVTGNLPKVIETLQESIQTYPGQLSSYININSAYQTLGQYDKALPYAQKAVELQPEDAIAAENLLVDLITLGRMDEAQRELAREHKLGMDSSTDVASQHLIAYFLLGDQQQVQRVVAEMAGHPDEFVTTQTLAITQQFAGQYRKAAATFQRAIEQAGHAKAPDAQAANLLTDALGRGMAGLCDGNEAAVEQALGLDKSKQTQDGGGASGGGMRQRQAGAADVGGVEQEISRRHADPGCLPSAVQGVMWRWRLASRNRRWRMPSRRSPIPRRIRHCICRGWLISSCMMPATRSTCSRRRRSTGQPCCCRGWSLLSRGATGAGASVCDGGRQGGREEGL